MAQDEATAGPDQRLTVLEMRAAEQEKTIEELSGQLAEQWAVFDQLQKRLEALTRRLLSVEEQTAPAHDAAPPPHY